MRQAGLFCLEGAGGRGNEDATNRMQTVRMRLEREREREKTRVENFGSEGMSRLEHIDRSHQFR